MNNYSDLYRYNRGYRDAVYFVDFGERLPADLGPRKYTTPEAVRREHPDRAYGLGWYMGYCETLNLPHEHVFD